MQKLKAAIINKDPSNVNVVYSSEQLQRLAELTDLLPGIMSETDVESGRLEDVEVLFSTWGMVILDDAQLAKMPKLKAVFYAGGATDSFARPMFKRNIKVYSAWLANAIPVAEFALAQILLGLKGYFRAVRELKHPSQFNHRQCGPGVYGATVALIGAGAISRKLQEFLTAFKVNVLVVPSRKENRTVSLEEAFAQAQVISNHLPNRDDNVGVLDGKLFRLMKPNAVFVNTGRGAQVNEKELLEVMRERPDLTALLDVTWPEPPVEGSPLYDQPNVLVSPHIAGSLNDEVHRMTDYMLEEFTRFASGQECLYEVKEDILQTSR